MTLSIVPERKTPWEKIADFMNDGGGLNILKLSKIPTISEDDAFMMLCYFAAGLDCLEIHLQEHEKEEIRDLAMVEAVMNFFKEGKHLPFLKTTEREKPEVEETRNYIPLPIAA